MSNTLKFDHIDRDTQKAIIDFINRAPYPDYLTRQWWLRDHPAGDNGGSLEARPPSIEVAETVLQRRSELPGGEMTSLEQLQSVAGFEQAHLNALAQTLSDYALHRNRAELFVDGPASLQVILDVIDSAQNYLHLIPFLFFNDDAGQTIARALAAKAQQGVEVRVLLDRRASENWLMDGPELRRHPSRYNIKALRQNLLDAGVRVVDPQPLERSAAKLDDLARQGVPEAWLREQEEMNDAIWSTLASWNHVDHRKIMIADGRRCLVMSCCIGNEYQYTDSDYPVLGDGNARQPRWHDAATLIEGGAAITVNHHFAKRWVLSGGDVFPVDDAFYAPTPVATGSDTVTIRDAYPGRVSESWLDRLSGDYRQENSLRHLYAHDLLWLAKKEVWIQNPYVLDRHVFKRWEKLLKSKPQLQFNLIRPHPSVNSYPGHHIRGMRGFFKQLFRRGDARLIKRGANIFEYARATNHIKIAVIDDWLATHGSYNLNYRSAKKDIELNAIIESRPYARQVKQQVFEVDLAYCRTVSPTTAEKAIGTMFLAAGDLAIIDMILPEVG